MLSVIMLSVVKLNVVSPLIVIPSQWLHSVTNANNKTFCFIVSPGGPVGRGPWGHGGVGPWGRLAVGPWVRGLEPGVLGGSFAECRYYECHYG
jgi:hypothetical protein